MTGEDQSWRWKKKKKEKEKKKWNHRLPPWQSNGADEPGPKSRVADGDLKTARDLAAIVAAVGQLKEAGKTVGHVGAAPARVRRIWLAAGAGDWLSGRWTYPAEWTLIKMRFALLQPAMHCVLHGARLGDELGATRSATNWMPCWNKRVPLQLGNGYMYSS